MLEIIRMYNIFLYQSEFEGITMPLEICTLDLVRERMKANFQTGLAKFDVFQRVIFPTGWAVPTKKIDLLDKVDKIIK